MSKYVLICHKYMKVLTQYILCYSMEIAKMTNDHTKMLMLTLPFMVRDFIAPEVLQYMHVLVYISMYCVDLGMYWHVDLGMYWYVLLCTRLRASIRPSRQPKKAPVSTACSQFLIQATRWWRSSSSAQVQQEQEFMFPDGLFRCSCGGWKVLQKRL
jgi:hypothetical protein